MQDVKRVTEGNLAARSKPKPKTEKELHAELAEAFRYLTQHALKIASSAQRRGVADPSWSGAVRVLEQDLGAISRELQALREWETTAIDLWKTLSRGAR